MSETRAPAISIIMGCRLGGNENSRLKNCLSSLLAAADNAGNIEILIKFDNDDEKLSALQSVLKEFEARVTIKYIVTARGAGYGDLHKAYLDLLRIADPSSRLFWVISDDIELSTSGWDSKMLNACSVHPDGLFVLQMLVMRDFDNITPRDALEACDPYPVWSRKWIGLQGGFGYSFSTDGWTSLLCHRLRTHYGLERRVFVDGITLKRHMAEGDAKGAARWTGIRQTTIDLLLSPQLLDLLDSTAQAFVCYAQHSGSYTGEAPPPHPRIVDTIPLKNLLKVALTRVFRRLKRLLGFH